MSTLDLVIDIISLAVNAIAIVFYALRTKSSKSPHYAALFLISIGVTIESIVGLTMNKWLWQLDAVLDVFRKAVIVHLLYLWIEAMREVLDMQKVNLIQKSIMGAFLLYVASGLLGAFGIFAKLFYAITVVIIIAQALFCLYLWKSTKPKTDGLARKRLQMLWLVGLTGLFALGTILALLDAPRLAAIANWLWVLLTLYPKDALLFYHDVPSAFDSASRTGTYVQTV
jgi:hypothetical protein